ncbi:glycoside hydrolase family 18 protein [Dongshaea marina]|uniref:glycosyl hydrolase family 18 protein n=1 Tax=Dongshaea marina TaxID=2047966 RepID=UPI000D3E5359|nr:glycosyl hydrolase family 18 protein [Dongshaea marina]
MNRLIKLITILLFTGLSTAVFAHCEKTQGSEPGQDKLDSQCAPSGSLAPRGLSQTTAAKVLFSPYKDVGISEVWDNDLNDVVLGSQINGQLQYLSDALPKTVQTVTLGFATGPCGGENWAYIPAQQFADHDIYRLKQHNINYIVSTGGAAGTFTCNSQQGMQTFLERYDSANFVGLDFDIENGYNASNLHSLMQSAAAVQKQWQRQGKQLRISLTLATFGIKGQSLNSMGETAVNEAKAAGLTFNVNLMTMDYGTGVQSCTPDASGSRCDMAQSAIVAAEQLHSQHAIPLSRIELTPMIGQNDTPDEVTSVRDMQTISQWAKEHQLAAIHFWAFDRDTPTGNSSSEMSGTQAPTLAYSNAVTDTLTTTASSSRDTMATASFNHS